MTVKNVTKRDFLTTPKAGIGIVGKAVEIEVFISTPALVAGLAVGSMNRISGYDADRDTHSA